MLGTATDNFSGLVAARGAWFLGPVNEERGTRLVRMTTEEGCVFCAIAAGDIPATVVSRSERVLAFRDLSPQAPTHVLVIPTAHHANVGELAAAAPEVLAELVTVGERVAAEEAGGSFRLVFNTGAESGQSVFHVHGHVLGGRSFTWPPG